MRTMNKCLYIVEGEIEERFIKQLKELDWIIPGRISRFNLMQKKLKKTDNILSKRMDYIYCIIDTDRAGRYNLETLAANLKQLKTIGHIKLLVQKENFEQELYYILGCSTLSKLCQHFNLSHATLEDLKKFLSQKINYKDYLLKENIKKYCSRPDTFKENIAHIPVYIDTKLIISGTKIMRS